MGQEIFYCSICQSQLRSSDFERGKGYKLESDAVCVSCAISALASFPAHKREQLEQAMAGTPPRTASAYGMPSPTTPRKGTGHVPLAPSTPKSGTGRGPLATSTPKSGTGRMPLATPPSATHRALDNDKNLKPLLLGIGIAAVCIIAGIYSLSTRHAPEDRSSRGSSPTPPLIDDTPRPGPATENARDRVARESARKAHVFANAHPAETLEQIRLFEQAAIDSRGTLFERESTKALEDARRRVHDTGEAELKPVDDRVRDACAKEDFRGALQILEAARKNPVTPEWPAEIDRRIQDVQSRVDTAFARVRINALLAKPDSPDVKALRERVAAWGFDRILSDFDRALADAGAAKPPPPPPPPPGPPPPAVTPDKPGAVNAEAFAASWNAALNLACGRDFAAAAAELEKSSAGLDDPALKSQAAADLEILRAVGAMHADALQSLSKGPAGRKISLTCLDFDLNPHKAEGVAGRARPGALDVVKGRSTSSILFGQITPRSLAELVPPKTKATAAIACLIEGDLAAAKELVGETNAVVPARYWTWASDLQRLLADAEQQKREGNARYAYYYAMLSQPAAALHADAALKCRKILEESAATIWVRRNRAVLKSTGETSREFITGPAQLRPAGVFRLEVPKTAPYWMSSIDIDPDKRRDNYVEMDFSTLPEHSYRAWAYVGACCSESLAFWAQGSELPGGELGEPVKHGMTSATKNHAGHAGRKGPSRWAWVEIPLPKYSAPGAKLLRLLTSSQGFSVGWMVVSPTRDKAPGDVEMKEWEKDLVHNVGPAGPTIGLAAWFKADAGTVIEVGKVAQWQDQSGHGRNAGQTMPAGRPQLAANVWNGKPVLRFDGTANQLQFDCPVNAQTALTIFMVSSAAKNQLGNDCGNYAALQWSESGGWGAVFLSPEQNRIAYRFGTGQGGNVVFWDRQPTGGPAVFMMRKDGAHEELWVQGALVAAPKDKTWPIGHTSDTATIGAGNETRNPPPKFFAGDIAEILVFTRALSEPERDAVERSLRAKYGI
ncbi:MAG TPA: hypothetical protein VE981_03135 [Planctomycetota bacterium]|nr:hypothetical protein [Planctomycetota bacterium]